MVKVIALGGFATSDATGVISAKIGDVLLLRASTADRLIKQGLVEIYQPKKKEE